MQGVILLFNVRTDLALEARELYVESNRKESDGIEFSQGKQGEIDMTTVKILDEVGAKNMGKPKGTYITIHMPQLTLYDGEIMDKVSRTLAYNIGEMMKITKDTVSLVVGLGNWNVTPDALGPKVISKLMITRHLKALMPETIDDEVTSVCAIAPGVLGITGIETGEVIRAIVSKIKPNFIICIDALASRRLDRVNRTIQLSNTGIAPGAGVGNRRMEINESTVGVPVISIGVPTVVDAATIASDSIDLVIDEMIKHSTKGGQFYDMLKSLDKGEKTKMIQELLNPYVGDLVVTPKDVDAAIDSISKIVSTGINVALQPSLDMEDINKFLN